MNRKTQSGWMLTLLKDAPAADREELLLDQIRVMVREILDLREAARLEPECKLFELGFRSMNVIELKTRLEAAFAVTLPVPLFFTYSTLSRLTSHLLSVARGDGFEPPPPTRPDDGKDVGVRIASVTKEQAEQIARLSDAEAEAKLLEAIADIEEKLSR